MENSPPAQGAGLRRVLWGTLAVVLIGVSAAAIYELSSPDSKTSTAASIEAGQSAPESKNGASEAPRLEFHGKIPSFEFTDRTGTSVGMKNLLGKVWVADFIFTNCGSTCPMMTVRMGELQDEFGEDDNFRLVSFTVDPERDTKERLTQYAGVYDARTGWYFLTGDQDEIYSLSRDAFKLGVKTVAPEDLEPGRDPILHSQRFVLVDQEANIRGYYNGTSRDEMKFLIEDARKLLQP